MDTTLKDWAQVITALGVLVAAIFSGLAALYAARAKVHAEYATTALAVVQEDVSDVKGDLKVVKAQTNGLTKALVRSEKIVSLAEGKALGIAEEKAKNGGTSSSHDNLGT